MPITVDYTNLDRTIVWHGTEQLHMSKKAQDSSPHTPHQKEILLSKSNNHGQYFSARINQEENDLQHT